MATKSIYKSINIKTSVLARGLVSALENAEGKKSAEVNLQHSVTDVKKEDIKKIIKNN